MMEVMRMRVIMALVRGPGPEDKGSEILNTMKGGIF
jgi:hypothetical protein